MSHPDQDPVVPLQPPVLPPGPPPAGSPASGAAPTTGAPAAQHGPATPPAPAAPPPLAAEATAGQPPLVSRRHLLVLGAAAVPALVGAAALWRFVPQPGGETGAAGGTTDGEPIAVRYDPTAHQWAFVCDASACIGCGRCVMACKLENSVPADPEYNRTWIERRVIAEDGTVYVDSPEGGIHGFPPQSTAPGAEGVTVEKALFVPRLCMQCANPPCVPVCPVAATYRAKDGIVLVDQEKCIGCGYCVVSCPYGARYLVPEAPRTPTGNAGVADKCTWCYHRITRGQMPACVVVCPVEARNFGDLNDPASSVSRILREEPVQVMKPELGTDPQLSYVGLEGEVA